MRAFVPALVCTAIVLGADPRLPAPVPRVLANDNRTPAGTLRDGILTLRLEARLADWHPQADDGPGAAIPAFAEVGRAPRIPGPLIRVPALTTVEVTLRNALPHDTLVVHGLHDRTGAPVPAAALAGVRLAPGEARTLRFRLDAPGTYDYWGTTMGRALIFRTGEDAQLTGAIVVDPRGAPPRSDRILVIGVWADTVGRAYVREHRLLAVMNGRSWPYTERLRYDVGDTVRWRVINASGDNHPMHLHGFYFRVDARGDGVSAVAYPADAADREVTESMVPGAIMDVAWVAERPGHWLFHCHIPEHIARRGPLGLPPAPMAHPMTHDAGAMGGLVVGVDVRPTAGYKAAPVGDDVRRLRLVVRRSAGGSDSTPYYGFHLGDDFAATVPDSGLHLGPPLVLTRGAPVAITVVNTLGEATSVHWHGIELESYYDGVAGWSGSAGRLAPLIAPGDSFTARFAPARAGTFIYHTHVDEERQEPAGLAGPIVVLEPGQRSDPATDHPVMITSPWSFEEGRTVVLLNGSATPAPLVVHAGVPQRFRFINMTTRRAAIMVELRRDTALATWRPLAHDGADLPDVRRQPQPALLRNIGIGQTFDFEVVPDAPGDLHLDLRAGGVNVPVHPLLATLPIRVVGAEQLK